jgi:hypothetical protein
LRHQPSAIENRSGTKRVSRVRAAGELVAGSRGRLSDARGWVALLVFGGYLARGEPDYLTDFLRKTSMRALVDSVLAADKLIAGDFKMKSLLEQRSASLTVTAVFCACMLLSHRAAAEGALAVGLPKDVAKQGFAYAYSTGKTDTEVARKEALDTCRKPADNKSTQARDLCAVITTFNNQCVAVALDPATGTPGVGWAVAGDLASAQSGAITQCKATAGAKRQDFCKIDNSRCDGTAK